MPRVEVVGGLQVYNEAVLAELATRDVHREQPSTGSAWIAIVHCDTPERWDRLSELVLDADCVTIAVLPTLEIDGYIRALSLGASGVVYLDSPSSMTADVVRAAAQGEVVLPRQAAQNLAALARRDKPPTELDDAETTLLRAVSAGRPIADIAAELHYSERTVRRHLQSIYIKLGVKNRTAAIAAAARLGLTDDE